MQTKKGEIHESILAMAKNEELMKKMSEVKTPEECYALVKDVVTVDFDTFTEQMARLRDLLTEEQNGLLTEEDLDSVAGGGAGEVLAVCGGAAGGTAAVVSAFAAA